MNEAEQKLVWIGRTNRRGGNDISIKVNLMANTHNGNYVGFTFRDECHKKFCGETPYFEVSLFKNCMFFKKSNSERGLLISNNKNTKSNYYAKIQSDTANYFAHWEGDYELKYNEFWELYYIERKDEEE